MESPPNMLRAAVEGYAGRLSYAPGETLTVHCTADVPAFDVEIARWGREREVVWTTRGVEGHRRELPEDFGANGCGWPASFELELPADWRPGYYEVTFAWEGKDEGQLELPAFFVLRAARDDARRSPILMVLTTNTYNAYNDWGYSPNLYTRGTHVTFERPMAPGFLRWPDGVRIRASAPVGVYDPNYATQRATIDEQRLSGWCLGGGYNSWEQPFVAWAEEEGIELDYAISSDLELRPEVLEDRKLVLSVGHDEYWSWGMRDAMEAYVAGGGNVCFFSGNAIFWQVRLEDDNRTMVSYKYTAQDDDPLRGTERQSGMWCDHVVGRPENHLLGVSFASGGFVRAGFGVPRGAGGYTAWRPEHWVFEGTDVRFGDLIGAEHGVVGFECDGCEMALGDDGRPVPTYGDGTPESFEILASTPARIWGPTDMPPTAPPMWGDLSDVEFLQWRRFGVNPREASLDELAPRARLMEHGNAVMGIYTRGGTVFTSGCTDWSYGIAGRDPVIVQITRNLIARLGA